jgi:glycosyltransferase involved in cell wall biosynthesis
VLKGDEAAFFTNGNDEFTQRVWARENGLSDKATLAEILLAQIEFHHTEVFYNTDPVLFGTDFVHRLPGCVRKAITWRNIPTPGADFSAYDLVLCNSQSLLKVYKEKGWNGAYFSPAHDPVMDEYATSRDRPIDVLFVGGYSRHHMRRAEVLEAVARLRSRYRIEYCLARSRFTRLAESPLGHLLPLGKYRRPGDIRAVSRDPIYGRDMYALIAKSKIVLNGTIDMSGADRGNIRCFEAMGCRSLLLSDEGVYPDGMVGGETLVTYQSSADVVAKLEELLQGPSVMNGIADAGYQMVSNQYSKGRQWADFQLLVSS